MGVIMDLRGRKSSREDDKSSGGGGGDVEEKKACIDCKTTKTPLWRVGPAGPKSLCNACGIKYRKKRTVVGLEKGSKKKKKKTQITSNTSSDTNISTSTTDTTSNTAKVASGTGNGLISESLRMSLKVWGEEMMLQKTTIVKKQRCQRKRKLREEEQAAFSLMALSCGSVFA